jgi:hypothetical protein
MGFHMQNNSVYRSSYFVVVMFLLLSGSALHSQMNQRHAITRGVNSQDKYSEIKIHQSPMQVIKIPDFKHLAMLPANADNIFHFLQKSSQSLHKLSTTTYCIDTALVYTRADTSKYLYLFDSNENRIAELIYKWKDGQWMEDYRTTCAFDAKGNMNFRLSERYTDDQWVGTGRFSYTYDDIGNQLSNMHERWIDGKWENNSLSNSTYDEESNLLSRIYNNWENGQWVSYYRYTCTYDAIGNLLSYTYEGDGWTGTLVNDFRNFYTYDVDDNLLSKLEQTWIDDNWVNYYRETYTYDENGKELSYFREQWTGSQWSNHLRSNSLYDDSGNFVRRLTEQWFEVQWDSTYRDTYTYDVNGNMLSYLFEKWTEGQWENYFRDNYTYDAGGNKLSLLHERWTDGRWLYIFRYNYDYDVNGNMIFLMSESWDESQWVPLSNFIDFEDIAGYNYHFYGYKVSLHYRQFVTEIAFEKTDMPSMYELHQNYPNPFNASTNISFNIPINLFVSLKVYDVSGREVATIVNENLSAGDHTKQWNAVNLSSGVYFYRIQAGSFTETKKLLLLR